MKQVEVGKAWLRPAGDSGYWQRAPQAAVNLLDLLPGGKVVRGLVMHGLSIGYQLQMHVMHAHFP